MPAPSSLYRVSIRAEDSQKRRLSHAWVRGVVRQVLAQEAVPPGGRVEVLLAGDDTLRRLNADYRDEDSVTDVLSFPASGPSAAVGGDDGSEGDGFFPGAEEDDGEVGQIALSLPQAERQAAAAGRSFTDECAHLIVHGVLHLLGYDHLEPEEEAAMRAREDRALVVLTGRPGRHLDHAGHEHARVHGPAETSR